MKLKVERDLEVSLDIDVGLSWKMELITRRPDAQPKEK